MTHPIFVPVTKRIIDKISVQDHIPDITNADKYKGIDKLILCACSITPFKCTEEQCDYLCANDCTDTFVIAKTPFKIEDSYHIENILIQIKYSKQEYFLYDFNELNVFTDGYAIYDIHKNIEVEDGLDAIKMAMSVEFNKQKQRAVYIKNTFNLHVHDCGSIVSDYSIEEMLTEVPVLDIKRFNSKYCSLSASKALIPKFKFIKEKDKNIAAFIDNLSFNERVVLIMYATKIIKKLTTASTCSDIKYHLNRYCKYCNDKELLSVTYKLDNVKYRYAVVVEYSLKTYMVFAISTDKNGVTYNTRDEKYDPYIHIVEMALEQKIRDME